MVDLLVITDSLTVLVALDPSITDSDVILAQPLSIVPKSIEQTSQPRRRLAVLLSFVSLVNGVIACKIEAYSILQR